MAFTPTRGDIHSLDASAFDGAGHLYEIDLGLTYTDANSTPVAPTTFKAALLMPNTADDEPTSVIMMENFCPNHSVIPHPAITKPESAYFDCEGEGVMPSVFTFFFGRYITTPPIEAILERGYGIAVIYPHEFVPDDGAAGLERLQELFPDLPEDERPGAVMVWSQQFSVLSTLLKEKSKLNVSHTIAYGHSRFGKSALVAAAFDRGIDGVIAHQSGTGGASLSNGKPGETVADITAAYPHWFASGYEESQNPLAIDQDHLLAAIAPRPILLGNAKRDVWSDPNGAFLAAQSASAIYNIYGSGGLRQTKLNTFDPAADIAFWMRRGTHGVTQEDWPAFLAFLDAHFKKVL